MSTIGKKLIVIPSGVTVTVSGSEVLVKGPKGEMRRAYSPDFEVTVDGANLRVTPKSESKKNIGAAWGSLRAHCANMVKGVSEGFVRKLEFEGIGYRAEVSGKEMVLTVGFTHPVRLPIPEGVTVSVTKSEITLAGFDKDAVGQLAAEIRRVRPPEPYKGTGIRYQGEVIRRKAGKKLAGAAGGGAGVS